MIDYFHIDEQGWIFASQTNSPTVMQFTGLKDCEGAEIYEGDVIKFSYGIPPVLAKAPVIFTDGAFYALPAGHTPSTILLAELLKMYFYNPEVIGNIYENPELLEAK